MRHFMVLIALVLAAPTFAQFVEPDVQVLASFQAENPGDNFGWVGEAIGDQNGDGAPEYIIGAILNADGGPFAGKAYVYDGASGALITTHTGQIFERFGFSVTGGADVDGDGTPDYAVGAPGVGFNPSRVVVYSGDDHGVIHEIHDAPLTFLGFDINIAGDVDGDGHADLVAGAPLDSAAGTFAGRVDVYSGADASLLWSTPGQRVGGNFGTAVTGLDDLNGDGVPEQGAGAFGDQRAIGQQQFRGGLAFVLDGSDGSFLRTLKPNGTASSFGIFFIHDAGDVDADGVGDIFVGDFGDVRLGPGSGRAYVYSGAEDEKLRLVNAENPGDGLGIGRGAGDVNGDGHADILVGAFTNSDGNFQGGKCSLVSGKNGHILRTFTGTLNTGQIGFDAVTLGDVDGDGLTDFLLTGLDVAFVVAGAVIDGPGEVAASGTPVPVDEGRRVHADRLTEDGTNMTEAEFRQPE